MGLTTLRQEETTDLYGAFLDALDYEGDTLIDNANYWYRQASYEFRHGHERGAAANLRRHQQHVYRWKRHRRLCSRPPAHIQKGAPRRISAYKESTRSQSRELDQQVLDLVTRIGLDPFYFDYIKVKETEDGGHNIYFGGIGKPDGEGHGHIATDSQENLIYWRDPFQPHGSHNFTRASYA